MDVTIPHDRLTVLTGVSGSGKSSLAIDTLFREGQRRYLESLSSHARQLLGKLERPRIEAIAGLRPALAVSQRQVVRNPRSTVGTLSELQGLLRLLLSRIGTQHCAACGAPVSTHDAGRHTPAGGACPECDEPFPPLTSSLLSFNTVQGACPSCRGLGIEDRVDPELLVADGERTLRQGALVPTTPSGYIVYSQVTMDVLDQICHAHDFSVDIPWKELSDAQRRVVLFGSDRIRVPFGKHPLSSRLRWKGITAKPRVEGTYKGIVPIIDEILQHKRNRGVLRFARTLPCRECRSSRLGPEARSVKLAGRSLSDFTRQDVRALAAELSELCLNGPRKAIAAPVLAGVQRRAALLDELGIGHLVLSRSAETLSGAEAQRIRLATQVSSGLRGVLYVLDEPSLGLHPRDHARLQGVLCKLRDAGNTVVAVEHDPAAMLAADYLIDIGPGPGRAGGRALFAGPPRALLEADEDAVEESVTRRALQAPSPRPGRASKPLNQPQLTIHDAQANNLAGIDVSFQLGALNVVTGVSGAGKSTLVHGILATALRRELHGAAAVPGPHAAIAGAEELRKIIAIDSSPIGRTPRSNPATYTKAFDAIRGLFADLPDARDGGLGKGHFSFNVKGGRCETCQGAGVETVGMHFLGDVEVTCSSCRGKRFAKAVLAVRYREHTILDVLRMSVARGRELFDDQPRLRRALQALVDVGLGYLPLGQPSTTLSGGEAQRVKLAAELGRPSRAGHTLYVLDEPTAGLHPADVERLLRALQALVARGDTAVVVEHDLQVICAADWIVDLGPGAGAHGGRLVASGTPADIAGCAASHTGAALRDEQAGLAPTPPPPKGAQAPIELLGVTTHNLDQLDVAIPHGRLTAVTGVSGSGKSSLALDTLLAACRTRFADGLPSYARRFLDHGSQAELGEAHGLTPAIGIGPRPPSRNPRSTVGTMTETYDALRLLFSRAGEPRLRAAAFSFNDHTGACSACRGLGAITTCDPERLIDSPDRPLGSGAMNGHRTGRHHGDPHGRTMALLEAVGTRHDIDWSAPWTDLDERAQQLCLHGSGDESYDVEWHYRRGKRRGTQPFTSPWPGLIALVDEEYARKHADHRGEAIRALMREQQCPSCGGARLAEAPRTVRFAGQTIAELSQLPVAALTIWLDEVSDEPDGHRLDERAARITAAVCTGLRRRLQALLDVGLGYLSVHRSAASLSGGEFQRVRLAAQLCAELCGLTYVLDEPTTGLHPRDTDRLLTILRRLRDQGNTVVVVEHDLQVIRAADHVIDLGPGPGERGGRIVAQGSPAEVALEPSSPTGRCLAGARQKVSRRPHELEPGAQLRGATARNLRGLDVDLPLGGIVAISGVSGAGKSALVCEVLAPSLLHGRPVGCRSLTGSVPRAVVLTDERAGSPHAGSTPATLLGIFDAIRTRFARTAEAKALGLGKADFSFNKKGGRCEACQGTGQMRVEMGFLPDVVTPCDACHGSRYAGRVLEVRAQGRSIAEVLAASAEEALTLFADAPTIFAPLAALCDVGLGYVTLGQPADTLSHGERQRLELARGLHDWGAEPRWLLLDEPTKGLHSEDVARLLGLLDRLVEEGHSVLIIEHHLDVLAHADWIIDLGPEGGARGGTVVAQGPPATIAECTASHTGACLRERERLSQPEPTK